MRISLLRAAAVCAVAISAQSAYAGVDAFFTETGGELKVFDPPTLAVYGTTSFVGVSEGYAGGNSGMGSATVFTATSSVADGLISFRNGNSTGGTFATATSYTSLRVDFTNDSAVAVQPVLNSTIFAAGMGWFIGGKNCLDNINSCNPLDDAVTTVSVQDFLPKALSGNLINLGGASFDFNISTGSGPGNLVYDLAGGFTVFRDTSTGQNLMVTDLANAAAALSNFRVSSNTASSWGVQWDATEIEVDFGLTLDPFDPLGTGDSASLFYRSTVSTFSSAECLAINACLFSYASFGDPIGRGGGVTGGGGSNASAFGEALSPGVGSDLILKGDFRAIDPPEDDPLAFPTTTFQIPTFENGILRVTAVPEPATWMFMIGGFALLGGQLRTRRQRAILGGV